MKKGWRIILLAVGLALFAWFIQRTGWADIRNTFAKLGPWMLVALVPYAVVFTPSIASAGASPLAPPR